MDRFFEMANIFNAIAQEAEKLETKEELMCIVGTLVDVWAGSHGMSSEETIAILERTLKAQREVHAAEGAYTGR